MKQSGGDSKGGLNPTQRIAVPHNPEEPIKDRKKTKKPKVGRYGSN